MHEMKIHLSNFAFFSLFLSKNIHLSKFVNYYSSVFLYLNISIPKAARIIPQQSVPDFFRNTLIYFLLLPAARSLVVAKSLKSAEPLKKKGDQGKSLILPAAKVPSRPDTPFDSAFNLVKVLQPPRRNLRKCANSRKMYFFPLFRMFWRKR